MQPIDYSSVFGGGTSPVQSFTQAFQAGAGVRQMGIQQDQQEQQLAQQQEMARVLREVAANPTPAAIARASVQFPQLSEQFKRSFDMLTVEQQQARLSATLPVYAAIQSGRPEIAARQLRERATALQNSGQEAEAKQASAMADLIEQHPETARVTTGLLLSSAMGADKFAETFGKLGAESRAIEQAPADLRKKNADATIAEVGVGRAKSEAATAAVKAKFAESEAIADLEKKGWDIKAVANDIEVKKQANRIAAMNAATSRANSDLQRQELGLKITEARAKLDSTIREKVGEAESSAAAIDNMLNTLHRLETAPGLRDVVGPIEGRSLYPTMTMGALSPFGSSGDDRANAVALLETAGAQAFLAQVKSMKGGMTGLTEVEGKKLQAAITNLGREQGEGQLRQNIAEAKRLMLKAREGISRSTGVPLGKPDTPAAPGARPPLDSFIR